MFAIMNLLPFPHIVILLWGVEPRPPPSADILRACTHAIILLPLSKRSLLHISFLDSLDVSSCPCVCALLGLIFSLPLSINGLVCVHQKGYLEVDLYGYRSDSSAKRESCGQQLTPNRNGFLRNHCL